MKGLKVNVLRHIFPFFHHRDQLENNPRHQAFGVFYDDAESPGIAAQNPVNQVSVCRIIASWVVHLFDQTGQPA